MDFLDGLKKEFQIANGVTLIFGLILLIYPGFSSRVLCNVAAAFLFIKGVWGIIVSLRDKVDGISLPFETIANIVLAAAGVVTYLRKDFVMSIIPFVFGAFLLVGGISSLQRAFRMKKMEYPSWSTGLIFTVLRIILAVVLILNPFSTAMALIRFIGICLVYDGLAGVYTSVQMLKAKARVKKAQEELRDLNLSKDKGDVFDDNVEHVDAEVVGVVEDIKEADDEE
ncbi:MAG: DUF308 domain-containing protein [Oscillospiraceae bacterium]|nr:DUF308 domain-containing protein [Oscillospiraceae bacterium]